MPQEVKNQTDETKKYIIDWLIANTDIKEPDDAFRRIIIHWAFDVLAAEKMLTHMMADYVSEKDLIIYGIEEGAEEWKSEAADWKRRFEKILSVLKELVDLKELKNKEGKTPDYLQRQPMAWENAKTIVDAGMKLIEK